MSIIFGNLLITISRILLIFIPIIGVLKWIIIIHVILSWVNADPYNFLVQIVNRIAEPFLAPFRNIIPSHRVGLDFSPLFAILAFYVIQLVIINFFAPTLQAFAMRLLQ
jgi:uncharacterized protein YggT (Ycf19 family)